MTRPIAARRHDDILKRIEATGTVSVEELSRKFGVSRETIRRDLKALAERGRVEVVHGGAARREVVEPALGQRSRENVEGKAAIGRAAAELVGDGMVVLLDSGTTTLAVARALRAKQNLAICTNSLPLHNCCAGCQARASTCSEARSIPLTRPPSGSMSLRRSQASASTSPLLAQAAYPRTASPITPAPGPRSARAC